MKSPELQLRGFRSCEFMSYYYIICGYLYYIPRIYFCQGGNEIFFYCKWDQIPLKYKLTLNLLYDLIKSSNYNE